jgi:hypothetical protein
MIALAVFGAAILGFGIYVFRYAERVTRDAHTDLQGMFGSTMPQLFAQPFTPAGARITGVVATAVGGLLLATVLVVAVVQLVTARS